MIKDHADIRGHVVLELFGPDGQLKERREISNLITNLMDAHVADQMSDQGEAAIGYMAIGSGTGQTASSTGLATSLARVALDSSTQGAAADDNDVIYAATFPAGVGTGTIAEAGLMRLDDNASLMAYNDTFSPIVKAAGDSLGVVWTVSFGAS